VMLRVFVYMLDCMDMCNTIHHVSLPLSYALFSRFACICEPTPVYPS